MHNIYPCMLSYTFHKQVKFGNPFPYLFPINIFIVQYLSCLCLKSQQKCLCLSVFTIFLCSFFSIYVSILLLLTLFPVLCGHYSILWIPCVIPVEWNNYFLPMNLLFRSNSIYLFQPSRSQTYLTSSPLQKSFTDYTQHCSSHLTPSDLVFSQYTIVVLKPYQAFHSLVFHIPYHTSLVTNMRIRCASFSTFYG